MSETGRILALDVGEARIGVAVSDPLRIIAQPHSVLTASSLEHDVAAVCDLAAEMEAVRIVVGLPLNLEGKPGPQAHKVLAFVERLREAVDIEVVTQDERYSTAAAARTLRQAGTKGKKRKQVIDKLAAQHILQTHLDRQPRGH